MVKKRTILEYCSNCGEEVEMPIVQRDPSNPHLIWVRCPKCSETKPVDIAQASEDLHEEAEPGAPEEVLGEEHAEGPLPIEGGEEPDEDIIPEVEPTRKIAKKKKPTKKKGKEKEAAPEESYKIVPEKAREYHPWEEYKPGETVLHPQWKQYGVILRVRRSGGGRSMIEVRFEKLGEKKLLVGQKPPTG